MKKIDILLNYQEIAKIQASRIETAVVKTSELFPLNGNSLSKLSAEEIGLLDTISARFCKLQDIIGSKIFPLILNILGEDPLTFRDKLNMLEKLEIIEDASLWVKLRNLRNNISYEYPSNYDELAESFNQLLPYVKKLLEFWHKLPQIIDKLPNDL